MLKIYIEKVVQGTDLTESEMKAVMNLFMTAEDLSPVQTGAFLGALQAKGISASELAGGVEAMKDNSLCFDKIVSDAMDIVGTGGDGGRTFNISTAAALTAAGAGLKVAKHGGRASSGKCGSADVLEALGIDLTLSPKIMAQSLVENGIGFFFAPAVHPLMSKMAPIRKQLGIRSFFNLLGPLVNPVPLKNILIGTADRQQLDLFADTLIRLNYQRAAVVSSADCLDEISCLAKTEMIEIKNGRKSYSTIDPREFFTPEELEGSLTGEDSRYNAKLIRDILESKVQGAPLSVVLLNSGAALFVAGLAPSLADGIQLARYSVESGAAFRKLDQLIKTSLLDGSSQEDPLKTDLRIVRNTVINSSETLNKKELL